MLKTDKKQALHYAIQKLKIVRILSITNLYPAGAQLIQHDPRQQQASVLFFRWYQSALKAPDAAKAIQRPPSGPPSPLGEGLTIPVGSIRVANIEAKVH